MPKKLLLADDSVVIQKLVGLSFANEDVELVTTDNGDDALVQAKELRPDLVLADVVMPGLSGYEVCEAIKQDSDLRDTPVLLLTGTFESFDEERARQAGADGHITKPFEAQALVERVVSMFRQAGPASEPVVTPTAADASLDFFDDGVDDLSSSLPPESSNSETPLPSTPTSPLASESSTTPCTPDSLDSDFDFVDSAELPPLDDPELLADPPNLEFDDVAGGPGNDLTIALMPEEIDVASEPQSPAVTCLTLDDMEPLDGSTSSEDSWPVVPDTADSYTVDPDMTVLGDDVLAGESGAATAQPSLTTIIMSNGENSSDGISFSSQPPVSADADTSPPSHPPVGFDSHPQPMEVDSALDPSQSETLDSALDSTPSMSSADAPYALADPAGTSAGGGAPDPSETLLADDLFSDPVPSAASSAESSWPAEPASDNSTATLDDVFEFGSSSVDAVPPAQFDEADVESPASASNYDVSSSDLGDPFATPSAQSAVTADDDLLASGSPASNPLGEFSLSDGLLAEPVAAPFSGGPAAGDASAERIPDSVEALPGAVDHDLDLDTNSNSTHDATSQPSHPGSGKGPDLTPVMRDRVHETLERVAWEAFADLSETLVKQILERVETIAWEVIPQMAEALVKEEIRRMKGESDD